MILASPSDVSDAIPNQGTGVMLSTAIPSPPFLWLTVSLTVLGCPCLQQRQILTAESVWTGGEYTDFSSTAIWGSRTFWVQRNEVLITVTESDPDPDLWVDILPSFGPSPGNCSEGLLHCILCEMTLMFLSPWCGERNLSPCSFLR